MRRVDRETPADLEVHCIVDNYSTHKHPAVQRWLKRTPRYSRSNPWLVNFNDRLLSVTLRTI